MKAKILILILLRSLNVASQGDILCKDAKLNEAHLSRKLNEFCKNGGTCYVIRKYIINNFTMDSFAKLHENTNVDTRSKNWIRCTCTDRWEGITCEIRKNQVEKEEFTKHSQVFCKTNKCKNNGQCLITDDSFALVKWGVARDKYDETQKKFFKTKKFWCACPDKEPDDKFEYVGKLCKDVIANGTSVGASLVKCSHVCKQGTCLKRTTADVTYTKAKLKNIFLAQDDQYCICKPGRENREKDPKCKECNKGAYSEDGLSCVSCSEGCLKPRKCGRKTGKCKRCKEEWEGEKCDQKKAQPASTGEGQALFEAYVELTASTKSVDSLGSFLDRLSQDLAVWGEGTLEEMGLTDDDTDASVSVSVRRVRASSGKRRRYRSRRQAADLRLQADFEIILPAAAAEQTDLSSDISAALKENSEKFESSVLPGLKIDKQSITVSPVRISEIDDEEGGTTIILGVFIVTGAAIAVLLAVAIVSMVVVRRNRNKQRQQVACRNMALMYAMPEQRHTANIQHTGRDSAPRYTNSRKLESSGRGNESRAGWSQDVHIK